MKKTIAILSSALMLSIGLMVATPVLGACGDRPDCGDCVTEETCSGQLLCSWDGVDTCSNQTISPVIAEDITSLTANISGLVTDAMPLILLAIGLPLGFWIIGKLYSFVPKK